jgi:hypothetical protein
VTQRGWFAVSAGDVSAFRLIEPERRPAVGAPLDCERCGTEADVDWLDVSTFGESGQVLVMGRSACATPGCVNEHGSRAVLPPDDPGRWLTPDDHAWKRRHYRLAAEYAAADRALREGS